MDYQSTYLSIYKNNNCFDNSFVIITFSMFILQYFFDNHWLPEDLGTRFEDNPEIWELEVFDSMHTGFSGLWF